MSQEHEKTSTDTQVSDGIHPEAAPFEPGYQPGTLPQLNVPDLAEDAQGLTAEALANVPTLTELVEPEAAPAEVVNDEAAEVLESCEPNETAVAIEAAQASSPEEAEVPAQAEAAQADTWGEHLQARMGKLTDDIHTLNVRLDRLEERNKTKV
jgi:FtsZ-binding cell division protein ZapB